MDFNLSREHQLVRKMMAEFTENEVKPIAAETDKTSQYPRENIEKLFDLGVMGMCVPKEYGGAGADPLASAICIEELSKQCASTGDIVATHNGLCCDPIITHGTEAQKAKYLPMLTKGHKVGAFCLTESDAGSDAAKGQTEAKLDGDHYVLNGSKIFITNGYVADVFVVFAMTDKSKGTRGISAFIVESSFPGFSVGKHEEKMGLHGSPTAEIVAQAGKLGAVTVATNMAGRGTDIMLGGNAEYLAKAELRKAGLSDELIAESTGYADTDNEEILNARKMFAEAEAKYKDEIKAEADQVRAAGGLFILGTERHESRRIDNQLRGRAGRQGDPGESRFYLSLEDDIMRLFGSERVMGMMEKLGVDEDTPIDAKILSNAIENAQKQVESRNFQTRKTVLEYDDVMNTQRKVIYEQRRKVLDGENLKESVQTMLSTVISTEVQAHMGELKHMDAENWREVCAQFRGLFLRPDEFKFTDEELQQYDAQALTDLLQERASDIYARKEAELGEPLMRELERVMMLRVVDEYWMDNIDAMQELRQGIGLRAYGQNDPVVAYKKEGYEMFESMIAAIQAETIRRIFLARVQVGATTVKRERVAKVTGESAGSDGTVKKQPVKKGQKVGRNDPCPCGSGKKYKKCCGMHEDE